MAKIQIMGKDELEAFLRSHKKSVIENSKKVVMKYGSKFQTEAKKYPPTPNKSGTLARSISLDIADNGLTAVVYPTANYAQYVEYGTRYMNAQPFMRPTMQKIEPHFVRAMDEVMEKSK